MEPSDATDHDGREAVLALKHDKSQWAGCPTPRPGWAAEVIDSETGEISRVPLGCGRNSCPHCRRRNVQVTAAKMGLNQTLTDRPVTHAVLSTTRDWATPETLAAGWEEMSRLVRRDVCSNARYAWFREWTEGKRDGVRRTHWHSTWALDDDDQAAEVAAISNRVWKSRTNAWSEKAHGWQRVYDAGGLTRYIAGLVGHHLKANQAPPPGWSGRRFGTSRGFYALDTRELDRQAKTIVRDDRLMHHLERVLIERIDPPDGLPVEILDEVLTPMLEAALERARSMPRPRIVPVPVNTWAR